MTFKNLRLKLILLTIIFFNFGYQVFSQDGYIVSIKTHYRIVGITYAVFSSSQIFELGALGRRRVNDTALALTTDKFLIGSNTKAITAFIAANLVENKKINWNTRYFDLFPDLKADSRKEYWNITIQDLLSHRAKMNAYHSVKGNLNEYIFSGNSIDQKIKFASNIQKEPAAKPDPGQVYVYSNEGISYPSDCHLF